MLIGNGYAPGHAAYALELLRETPGVRSLFDRGCDARAPRQARPRSATVRQARSLAARPGPIVTMAKKHTTVAVERATLRLMAWRAPTPRARPGSTGWWTRSAPTPARARRRPCPSGTPAAWGGRRPGHLGAEGVGRVGDLPTPRGQGTPSGPPRLPPAGRARASAASTPDRAGRLIRRIGDAPRKPWIYLIVATGDIHARHPVQAQAAAREGADVIAVIRSTGQSLLDFVPEGRPARGLPAPTPQENFRLMRAALDETSRELGATSAHELRLRPVHARRSLTLAGLERLDMMLNDSM